MPDPIKISTSLASKYGLNKSYRVICTIAKSYIISYLMSQTHVGTHDKHSVGHCYVSPKLLRTKNYKMANSKATLQYIVNTQLHACTTEYKFYKFLRH